MTSRNITIVGFLVIILIGIGLQAWASTGRSRLPTVPTLLGAINRRPVGKAVLLFVWFWCGWHFLAR